MTKDAQIIIRLTAMACSCLLLGSCAVLPAGLKAETKHGSRRDQSLAELLQQALDEVGEEETHHSLAHFVSEWFEERDGASAGEIVDGDHRFRVRFVNDRERCYLPGYFDLIKPAGDFSVQKITHHRRGGFGAPLLAIRENTQREAIEKFYPSEAITRPITAVATEGRFRAGTREVTIRLLCPLHHETVTDRGTTRTLAADFSAPWAALLQRTRAMKRSEITDLLRRMPSREPQLFLMEPYDHTKEPLIMVHGLLDTPLAWAVLSNDLWANDEVRRRYQIWHFLYNTSAPALYSGRLLRNQLHELRPKLDPGRDDPAMQSTTVLAHSMGGIVTRRMITRPGDVFWDAAFTRPLESLELTRDDRAALREAFFWEPELHVKRVIFVAVPHRGSDFADNPVGRLGRLLVSPPNRFREFYERISEANPGAFTAAYAELGSGRLDSVHSLSPKQPTLQILSQLPRSHPVAIHSIIGNRGKPGPIEDSSDGIVPYWSSHFPDADSEMIVPAGHGAYRNEDAMDEIVRLLLLPRGKR